MTPLKCNVLGKIDLRRAQNGEKQYKKAGHESCSCIDQSDITRRYIQYMNAVKRAEAACIYRCVVYDRYGAKPRVMTSLNRNVLGLKRAQKVKMYI